MNLKSIPEPTRESITREVNEILTQKPLYTKPGTSKKEQEEVKLLWQSATLVEFIMYLIHEADERGERNADRSR